MVYNVSCSNDTSAPSLQLITDTDGQTDKVICNGRFVVLLAKTLFGGGSSQHIYADHASSVRTIQKDSTTDLEKQLATIRCNWQPLVV